MDNSKISNKLNLIIFTFISQPSPFYDMIKEIVTISKNSNKIKILAVIDTCKCEEVFKVDLKLICLFRLFIISLYKIYVFVFRKLSGKKSVKRKNIWLFLKRNKIPIIIPPRRNVNSPKLIRMLSFLKPDIFLVIGCNQIFSEELLKVPRITSVNFHYSLLPKYGGRGATIWPLYFNEKFSGITFHHMDVKVDRGDIILQKQFPIDPRMDGESLAAELIKLGVNSINELIELLCTKIPHIPQKGHRSYFYSAQIKKFFVLDPKCSVKENLRRIKARGYLESNLLTNSFIKKFGSKYRKIWHTLPITGLKVVSVFNEKKIKIGKIKSISLKGIDIQVIDGILRITHIAYIPTYLFIKIIKFLPFI